MCGIWGYSRLTQNTHPLTPVLALAMEGRGQDGWGCTDGDEVVKSPLAISKSFWHYPDLITPSWHTRGASQGAVSQRNAHPFEYISTRRGVRVVGMHNGHIYNHAELAKKYPHERKEFQVDSEHIFAQLAEGLPLGELHGYGAVVWWEMPIGRADERVRYVSCFQNPALHICKLSTGEVVYASTRDSIELAARMSGQQIASWYEVKQNVQYRLGADDELYALGELAWPRPTAHIINNGATSPRSEGTCLSRTCFREVEKTGWVFCAECVQDMEMQLGVALIDREVAQ